MSETAELPFVDVATFVAKWPSDRVILIARGVYSPSAEGDRWIAFTLEDRGRLAFLGEHWLREKDLADVRDRNPTVQVGRCDAMFATPFRYVWCQLDGSLVVWRRTRRIAMIQRRRILLRRPHKWRQLVTTRLDNVEVYVSPDWVTRAVRFNGRRNAHWDVARQRDRIIHLDPTYDRISLDADTHWATCLAEEAAAVTRLPLMEPP